LQLRINATNVKIVVFIESNNKDAYCAHENARNARNVENIDAFMNMSQLKVTQIWDMRLNEYLKYWSLKALKSVSVTLYKLRMNWKIMNEEKFINILRKQMSKSLLNQKMKCQCINEYTKQLLNALRKIIEIFTFWVKSHEMIKAEWMKKCIKIIKNMQQMRKSCWIIDDWVKYIQACDKKSKIIRKQKCSKY